MYKQIFLFILILCSITIAQPNRREFKFPEISGYVLMKCDFHTHTVYSDGNVWPHIRVIEAWRDGLDAIAITDHFEYKPHQKDLPVNYNRSFEIAQPEGVMRNIIVIRGGEVTRKMPPGHLNAIFLKDNEPLSTDSWMDALKNANDQGGFIFWNHPGWKGQQPDGIAKWYDEHTQIYNNGYMQAIEIVNGIEYYPEAHKWAIEKNLTIIGNSDTHDPIGMEYNELTGHRPVTIVLAKEATEEGIKDALKSGRTIIYHQNNLIGKEEYLNAFFVNSITIKNPEITLNAKESQYVQICNKSELSYELELSQKVEGLNLPESIKLLPDRTVLLPLRAATAETELKIDGIKYNVKNCIPEPYKSLSIELPIKIRKDAGDKAAK